MDEITFTGKTLDDCAEKLELWRLENPRVHLNNLVISHTPSECNIFVMYQVPDTMSLLK